MVGLDNFKSYIKEHPGLKDEVLNHKMSWQEIYETYSLSIDDPFPNYKKKERIILEEEKEIKDDNIKSNTKEENKTKKKESTEDMIKNVLSYVKKIDPDNVTKYVTSIQKVLELLASFGAGATASAATKKNTTDPLFDRKFDDWY